MKRRSIATIAATAAMVVGLGACSSSSSSTPTTGPGKLVGVFKITAGSCTAATTSGSYFRMVAAGGTTAKGPFIANSDSTCATNSYSPLSPGTDGGLITGSYQTQPIPPMDATKNGLAAKIIQPVKFFAVNFALSSNPTDPQSGIAVPVPSVTASASNKLSAVLSALSVAWNGQQFNQGSPKPDGSHPGNTVDATGTYNPSTGAYTLDWSSQIVGGPFNGFTGVWHLEGTFTKK